jgi:tetratricopeptide (TPR) repeat protein
VTTPDDAHTLRDLAAGLGRAGRHAEAAAVYERLLAQHPDWLNGWYNLGQAQWRARRFDAALNAYQRALDGGISQPEEVHLNRSVILASSLARPDAARHELERALAFNPAYVPALLNLGNLCEQDGQRNEARHWYAKALQLDPGNAMALSRLPGLHTLSDPGDPLIAQLQAAVSTTGRSMIELADLGFGLGKALDDVGRWDEAFAAYTAANAASRRAGGADVRYDAAGHERYVERLIERFRSSTGTGTTRACEGSPPIFICGMFRSGSTLIEQVLAAHPEVTAGGELDLLPALAQRHLPPDGDWSVLDRPGDLDMMARSYLDAVAARLPESRRVTTDKRPDNFLQIGLIKALFPTARIVYTRRDPLDNCLSVYFLHLGRGMPYSLDLLDTAHWYREHERLMAHWLSLYGDDIHTVDYDRFVVDPQPQIRALLAFCGLPWDPACLSFHAAQRRVETASLWQVRQPLYQRASGRWRNYASHLGPLRQALGLDPSAAIT